MAEEMAPRSDDKWLAACMAFAMSANILVDFPLDTLETETPKRVEMKRKMMDLAKSFGDLLEELPDCHPMLAEVVEGIT